MMLKKSILVAALIGCSAQPLHAYIIYPISIGMGFAAGSVLFENRPRRLKRIEKKLGIPQKVSAAIYFTTGTLLGIVCGHRITTMLETFAAEFAAEFQRRQQVTPAQREEARRTLEERLGIAPDASSEEIRRAYLRFARHNHPDKNPSPDATQRFQEISNAYQILTQSA